MIQGEMVVTSRRIPNPELPEEEKQKLLKQPKYKSEGISETQPFMFLSLDLPAKPLFVDPHKQIAIPQVTTTYKYSPPPLYIYTPYVDASSASGFPDVEIFAPYVVSRFVLTIFQPSHKET